MLVLGSDGLGVANFGTPPEPAIATVGRALGRSPDTDSGWIESFSVYGTCPGTEVRAVRWSSLTLLFTNGVTEFGEQGSRHFFSYTDSLLDEKGQSVPSAGLVTDAAVGLGSSVADLKRAYADRVELYDEEPFGPGFIVEDTPRGSLSGALSGLSDSDTVQFLAGGIGCGE